MSIEENRTALLKKNIGWSFLIKGVSIITELLLVSITIKYLTPTKYGVWITLSSIIGWFGFFDIGLGNGLRNKFAESIAQGNHKSAQIYVSTTYALIASIVIVLLILFFIINRYINWGVILNVSAEYVSLSELNGLAIVIITFFCFRFLAQLINTILIADQKPAIASLIDLISRLIILFIVYYLTIKTTGSLIKLGITISGIPVIILTICSLLFFNGKYYRYRPQFRFIKLGAVRDIFGLGLKFFIIQIAAILLYQTNAIIIAQLFGPQQVTHYTVAFKYFSTITMVFSILLGPIWSAVTDAWTRDQLKWIKKLFYKIFGIWIVLSVVASLMLIFSNQVFRIWIGNEIQVQFSVSVLIAIWTLLNAWNLIFSTFLNGIGKIKLQSYIGIFSALINVPLAIYLGKEFGIEGVLMANIFAIISGIIIYPIQYRKIINNESKGIWNK